MSESVHDMVYSKIPQTDKYVNSPQMLVYLDLLSFLSVFNNVCQADENRMISLFYERALQIYSDNEGNVRKVVLVPFFSIFRSPWPCPRRGGTPRWRRRRRRRR